MTDSFDAARASLVLFDRSDRGRLEILGPDRAKFLHNLSTNDIKHLVKGTGCEAFITNLQGKTLGYVNVLADDPQLLVRTDPGALAGVMPHLQKYGLFDDVTLEDVGPSTFEFHLAGPKLSESLGDLIGTPPLREYLHYRRVIDDRPVWLVIEFPTGLEGLTIIGRHADRHHVHAWFQSRGCIDGDSTAFEALRVEAGTPVFGRDVTPENLPQEISRDRKTISFTKGCYLGQETVARIDALGHVNKLLRRLTFDEGPVPLLATTLTFEGKAVGHVTSSVMSPGLGKPIGLGIVKVAQAKADTTLSLLVDGLERHAMVSDLPA